jgi:hypothetical protein
MLRNILLAVRSGRNRRASRLGDRCDGWFVHVYRNWKQHARSAAIPSPHYDPQHVTQRAFARNRGNDSAAHYALPPKTSVF